MDFEAQRKKRMQDLEEKRRRLEEMRKLRKDRADAADGSTDTAAAATTAAAAAGGGGAPVGDGGPAASHRAQVDDLVNSLLDRPPAPAAAPAAAAAAAATAPTATLPSAPSSSSGSSSSSSSSSGGASSSAASAAAAAPPVDRRQAARDKAKTLVLSKCTEAIVHIPPAAAVTYDKECQTEPELAPTEPGDDSGGGGSGPRTSLQTPLKRGTTPDAHGSGQSASSSLVPPPAPSAPSSSSPRSGRKTLSEVDQQEILGSDAFRAFVRHSSRIVERTLTQLASGVDVMRDYAAGGGERGSRAEGSVLSYRTAFSDHGPGATPGPGVASLRGRPVMDLHASPHYPELFLAAYGAKPALKTSFTAATAAGMADGDGAGDPPGAVAVWSLGLSTRPEYVFTASSPVLVARFHPEDAPLILGGCYSGQVLLWDLRAKASPVQRSSMSGKGHKHPVYGMSLTGSGSSLELVTASTDGTLCHWDVARLSEPTNVSLLSALHAFPSSATATATAAAMPGPALGFNSVHVSCVAFSRDDAVAREIVVGGGNGSLYKGTLPLRPADPIQHVHAHTGLVTSVQTHPSPSKHCRDLLLTSSLDWKVKLWNLPQSPAPLLQFASPSYDYVTDVRWSPTHPAVFATIASGGDLALWNLAKSVSEPVETLRVAREDDGAAPGPGGAPAAAGAGAGAGAGTSALNKLLWARDGRALYVGDAKGAVHVVGVGEAAVKASAAEESAFEAALLEGKEAVRPNWSAKGGKNGRQAKQEYFPK